MPFIRDVFEAYQHLRLRRLGARVRIDRSTRLLRTFGMRFLVAPENRAYFMAGENCILNCRVTFESAQGQVNIGSRVYIGSNSNIICRERVSIGNDVTIAWGVTIYDHNSHSFDWLVRQRAVNHFYRTYGDPQCYAEIDWTDVKSAPIFIADRVWIGFDVVILKGVTIGEGAIVGARSVVTRDVEPWTVVAGNPAVPIRKVRTPAKEDLGHG